MKMFIQEGDVFHIEEELKEDSSSVIMPSDGITSIWPFENNFLDIVFNNFDLSILFPIIQLMNELEF